jgi:hypothetical protein
LILVLEGQGHSRNLSAQAAFSLLFTGEELEVLQTKRLALLGVTVDVGQKGSQLRYGHLLQLRLLAAYPLQFTPCTQHGLP